MSRQLATSLPGTRSLHQPIGHAVVNAIPMRIKQAGNGSWPLLERLLGAGTLRGNTATRAEQGIRSQPALPVR